MQIRQKLSHNVLITLSHDMNCSIEAIRHPSHQLQPLGLMQGRLAEKHTLNQTNDRGFHANRHGRIISQSRGSAIEQWPMVGDRWA